MIDQHRGTVYISGTAIPIESAQLMLDMGWSPYVQGTIVIPRDDQDTYSNLNPVEHDRVRFTLKQVFGQGSKLSDVTAKYAGGTLADVTADYAGGHLSDMTDDYVTWWNAEGFIPPTSRTVDLLVRRLQRDRVAGTTTIDVASDEALLNDDALVALAPITFTTGSTKELVSTVLARYGAVLDDDAEDGPVDPDGAVWEPGVTAWAFLEPHLKASALMLWCDSRRRWKLLPSDAYVGAELTTITKGKDLITFSDVTDIDRDFFDAVVLKYTWTTFLGDRTEYVAAQTSPNPVKVLSLSYDARPGLTAQQAADDILSRGLIGAVTGDVSGVSNYDTEPRQALHINLGDTTVSATITAVLFDLASAEMRLKPKDMTEE